MDLSRHSHGELVLESFSLHLHVVIALLRGPLRLLHGPVPPRSLPE